MKLLVWIGMIVGSMIGGYIPALWGSDGFSAASIIGNCIGGILGVLAGLKLANMWGVE